MLITFVPMKKLLLTCCGILGLLLLEKSAQAQTPTLYFPPLAGST
jgi:hypothetical protein